MSLSVEGNADTDPTKGYGSLRKSTSSNTPETLFHGNRFHLSFSTSFMTRCRYQVSFSTSFAARGDTCQLLFSSNNVNRCR
jgi:hypothetical protein